MRLSALSALLPALRRAVRRRRTHPNYLRLLGLIGGVYALTACHLFFATFGTAPAAVTAVVIALAVGIELGWKPSPENRDTGWQHWGLHLGLAAWMVLLPFGLELAMSVIGRIPLEVMALPGRLVLLECLVALALIGPVVFAVARWPLTAPAFAAKPEPTPTDSKPKRRITSTKGNIDTLLILLKPFRALAARWTARRRRLANEPMTQRLLPIYLRSLAVGIAGGVLLFAPLAGLHITAMIAAGLSVGVVIVVVWKQQKAGASFSAGTAIGIEENDSSPRSRRNAILHGLSIAMLGGLAAVLIRMQQQLAATSAYLIYLQSFAILFGAAWGIRRSNGNPHVGNLVAASSAAMVLVAFPLFVATSLWISVFVVQPVFTMAARGGLVLVVLLPLGYGWGRLTVQTKQSLPRALSLFPFAAGFLAVRWVGFSELPVAMLLIVLTVSLLALSLVRWFIERPPIAGWKARCAVAGTFGVVIAAPFLRTQYDPLRTARLLFGTEVFVARMQGLDDELLPHLDEARPVAVAEGERGTISIWRYRGTQLQIRENGVPKALISTRTSISPQYSAEVMPAALPMILHTEPRRVMLLGLPGGVSLTTTLSFPVHDVTCIAGDAEVLSMLRRTVWTESRERPDADERVKLLALDPAVAVACQGQPYDVIVSSPDQSALLQSTPYFTRGFYQRVANRLSDDGIFCQRFQQMDYGPGPLRAAVTTLQAVFRNVVAIEIAAGEMALLATNSEHGLVRKGLLDRLQAPHVRTVLSRIGWDWSLPLNLTAYSHDGLRKFAEAGDAKSNTAANGLFAFRLPQEMMRWGPKHQELFATLAPHGTRFLESPGIDGNDETLLRRLAELAGQRKLMTQFPDQWWAYRKTLRQQLKQRPRTLIKSVRNGGGKRFHPEDERRMDYFRQLSRAARNPTPERILKVVQFTESYDPLITYFAHSEAAALFQRGRPADPRAELWHRLHGIYYAHPRDRSVRDVSRALVLLADHTGLVDSDADRWDHLNALLQTLQSRWITRGLVAPRKPLIVLNDIEESLEAAEKAFATMDKLHAAAGVEASAWRARRRVLQTGLTRPLETYRARLLKHHHFERAKIKEMLRKLEEETMPAPEKPAKGQGPSPTPGVPRPSAN